jgi:hypothetical protein
MTMNAHSSNENPPFVLAQQQEAKNPVVRESQQNLLVLIASKAAVNSSSLEFRLR